MIEDVPLELLKIRENRVRHDIGDLTGLMNSMREFGQFNPLIIDNEYYIIEGTRRFISAKNIGWSTIRCERREFLSDYEKVSIETDENLRRKNFNPAEEAVALALRKKAYLKEHPEKARGGDRRSDEFKVLTQFQTDPEAISFASMEAERLKISERSIYRLVKIGEFLQEGRIDSKLYLKYAQRKISQKEMMKLIRKDSTKKAQDDTVQHEGKKSTRNNIDKASSIPIRSTQREDKIRIVSAGKQSSKKKVQAQKKSDTTSSPITTPDNILSSIQESKPYLKGEEDVVKELQCQDCQRGVILTCPECRESFILCQHYTNPFIRKITSKACDNIKEKNL